MITNKYNPISRRAFMRGADGATATAILPSAEGASAMVPSARRAPSEFMALFESCDGYCGDFVLAIGRHDADPEGLAEELLNEMIERQRPADVLPPEMVTFSESLYLSKMPEENRPAAIAHIAASFRQGWGRWDCASRGQFPDCDDCIQIATGNDLLCGGEDEDYPPIFDTCSPDAPGAKPYLIWENR